MWPMTTTHKVTSLGTLKTLSKLKRTKKFWQSIISQHRLFWWGFRMLRSSWKIRLREEFWVRKSLFRDISCTFLSLISFRIKKLRRSRSFKISLMKTMVALNWPLIYKIFQSRINEINLITLISLIILIKSFN